MKRRNFVWLATVGVAALAIPTWYYTYGRLTYDKAMVEPEMLSYIWDDETINEIGEKYQDLFPDESTERKLVKLLSLDIASESKSVNEILKQQIQNDYATNKMVMVDGWLLSLTEARQCALFSLTQPN